MAPPPDSPHGAVSAARTGVVGTAVVGFAFFDSILIGAPIALLAASFRPSLVYAAATIAVVLLVIGCCRWIDRHWDDWFSGNGTRIEHRLESMRASRLLAHPVAWLQRGSDRSYAFAAAVANPILVAALARVIGGTPVGERRVVLGAVAYAIPYVAMWAIVGLSTRRHLRRLALRHGQRRCARHDSNVRPLPPQGSALSPELRALGDGVV